LPTYNADCSDCGYESVIFLSLSELSTWDIGAICPSCQAKSEKFRRVIKHAPAIHGGAKASARLAISKKQDDKDKFRYSGEKDAMRHKAFKNTNHEQVAAARESVAKGEFEGF
jgi:hypothetical protein